MHLLDVTFALFLALHAMRPRLTQYTHHGFSKTIASLFHAHTSARPSFSHLCKANDALDYGRVSYAQHALLRPVPFTYLTGASSELRLHMETPSTFWSRTTGLLFSDFDWNANATVVSALRHPRRLPIPFWRVVSFAGMRSLPETKRDDGRRGEASKETGVKARKEAGAGSMRSWRRKKSAERREGGSARAGKQDKRVEQVRGAGRGGALCLAHQSVGVEYARRSI
ncbi:hypothetical protein B0H11DRAFT_2182290 [Mycena galericulata]|nr:hypothetical protein B0H11DRAFT_2182290 [Mycena galericulata]